MSAKQERQLEMMREIVQAENLSSDETAMAEFKGVSVHQLRRGFLKTWEARKARKLANLRSTVLAGDLSRVEQAVAAKKGLTVQRLRRVFLNDREQLTALLHEAVEEDDLLGVRAVVAMGPTSK